MGLLIAEQIEPPRERKGIVKKPTLFEMLRTALYVGMIGYGGPAILALMKRVIVHQKQ